MQSTSFKDAVVDAMIARIRHERIPPSYLHKQLYPRSARSSGIRRLMVDIAVYEWSGVLADKEYTA